MLTKSNKKPQSTVKSIGLGNIAMYAFLIIMFLFTVYPILYVAFGSFKSNQELVLGGVELLPKEWTFSNYIEAWELANFGTYTKNSILLSTAVMLITLVISTMAGYCFSRKEFFGKNVLYGLLVAFMFMNVGSVSLRPLFELAIDVNMYTSMWSVILIAVGTNQATYIFLAKGYMESIPKTIDEAAKIDGCGFFRIYWNLILPLLKPILASIGLLSFRSAWNEYILPLIFTISNPENRPLTVGVVSLQNSTDGAAAWNIMFAGATMSIVPIIIIYLLLSKYFISGLASGAVKG